MSTTPSQRPALRLVQGALERPVEWAWFCGHCAAGSPQGQAPAPSARVCRSCGLGLLLEARSDAIPSARDAFLVVDASLSVQAMSRAAQALLTVDEALAVNRPVAELLVPADAEAGVSGFARAIAHAVGSDEAPRRVFVRPWNTFGIRLCARVAACGPPRAALLVLERGDMRPLRAVRDN